MEKSDFLNALGHFFDSSVRLEHDKLDLVNVEDYALPANYAGGIKWVGAHIQIRDYIPKTVEILNEYRLGLVQLEAWTELMEELSPREEKYIGTRLVRPLRNRLIDLPSVFANRVVYSVAMLLDHVGSDFFADFARLDEEKIRLKTLVEGTIPKVAEEMKIEKELNHLVQKVRELISGPVVEMRRRMIHRLPKNTEFNSIAWHERKKNENSIAYVIRVPAIKSTEEILSSLQEEEKNIMNAFEAFWEFVEGYADHYREGQLS